MKTSNYLAKLPQEATIKNIQAFLDYDLITFDVLAPRQRLCPRGGSTDCIIKDSAPGRPYTTSLPITGARRLPFTNAGSTAKNVARLSMRIPTGFILHCT